MTNKEKKAILIVEDDQPIAGALKLKLEKNNFLVQVCTNGNEAIELLIKEDFDLILLDLMMPEKDGFAFLLEAKTKKIKTPVIVMSNLGQPEDINRATELGAIGYFVKSNVSIAEVVDYIKKLDN